MSEETFGLGFPGRARALEAAAAPPSGRLVAADRRKSTAVTLCVGDNLEVLKCLGEHIPSVDAIYIDPPYNRGRDFVYRGIYSASAKAWSHDSKPRRGDRRLDAAARRSAPWLEMMLPRLMAARALMADTGVLFASIDDAEVHHLRLLLDEVFGRERFVAQIVVVSNRGGRDYLPIAVTHEYVLCYAKGDAPWVAEVAKSEALPLADPRGAYELRELRNRNPRFTPANRPNLAYSIWADPTVSDAHGCHPVALERGRGLVEIVPRNRTGDGSVWRWGKPKVAAAIAAGDPDTSDVVARRRADGGYNVYEKCRKQTTKERALWDDPSLRSERGSIELRAELGRALFDHPKPIELVRRCIALGCPPRGTVLDFFAGSGTAALAVAAQNQRDGGARRCVLVQWPEPTPERSIARQAGLEDVAAIARMRLQQAFGSGWRELRLVARGRGR
jgi:adenine-specific DNA-methyltransferase